MADLKRVRHKKRGTTYEILGEAEAQISNPDTYEGDLTGPGARYLREGDSLVVYRCIETGKLWLRYPDEFADGRFEDVT